METYFSAHNFGNQLILCSAQVQSLKSSPPPPLSAEIAKAHLFYSTTSHGWSESFSSLMCVLVLSIAFRLHYPSSHNVIFSNRIQGHLWLFFLRYPCLVPANQEPCDLLTEGFVRLRITVMQLNLKYSPPCVSGSAVVICENGLVKSFMAFHLSQM